MGLGCGNRPAETKDLTTHDEDKGVDNQRLHPSAN